MMTTAAAYLFIQSEMHQISAPRLSLSPLDAPLEIDTLSHSHSHSHLATYLIEQSSQIVLPASGLS